MARLPYLGYIATKDPRLAETIAALNKELELVALKAGVSGSDTQAPPNIRSIAVAAANGIFDIAITDPMGQRQPSLGIHYWVEYDLGSAFTNPFTIWLGAARNVRIYLGNSTLFFRAYSQYRNSPRSAAIVYGGSSPIGVLGGGSAGPAFSTSQGSGGDGSGGGFGGR